MQGTRSFQGEFRHSGYVGQRTKPHNTLDMSTQRTGDQIDVRWAGRPRSSRSCPSQDPCPLYLTKQTTAFAFEDLYYYFQISLDVAVHASGRSGCSLWTHHHKHSVSGTTAQCLAQEGHCCPPPSTPASQVSIDCILSFSQYHHAITAVGHLGAVLLSTTHHSHNLSPCRDAVSVPMGSFEADATSHRCQHPK